MRITIVTSAFVSTAITVISGKPPGLAASIAVRGSREVSIDRKNPALRAKPQIQKAVSTVGERYFLIFRRVSRVSILPTRNPRVTWSTSENKGGVFGNCTPEARMAPTKRTAPNNEALEIPVTLRICHPITPRVNRSSTPLKPKSPL